MTQDPDSREAMRTRFQWLIARAEQHPANSEAMDLPAYQGDRRYYLICSSQRCGSTLLCQLLAHHGLGAPHEYFNRMTHMPALGRRLGLYRESADGAGYHMSLGSYLRAIMERRTGTGGWFGFKAHAAQMKWLLHQLDVHKVFPGISYIWIQREDRLAQAVSMEIASQTQQWESDQPPVAEPVYRRQAIDRRLQLIDKADQFWQTYFQQIAATPLQIVYEDLVSDPIGTQRRIGEFLNSPLKPIPDLSQLRLKRQGNSVNRDWRSRYLEMESA